MALVSTHSIQKNELNILEQTNNLDEVRTVKLNFNDISTNKVRTVRRLTSFQNR